jgi:beta-galactosidase
VTLPAPAPVPNIPPATRPDGTELSMDTVSLRVNGVPVLPSGGEMHFSRVPAASWHVDLLKMKAGGLDVVSVYVPV